MDDNVKPHEEGAKTSTEYKDEIAVLEAKNEQLKQKLELLETRLTCANKRCACYHNNQKTCNKTKEK
jgi:hypothetical protein